MEQEIFYKVIGDDEHGHYGSNAVGIMVNQRITLKEFEKHLSIFKFLKPYFPKYTPNSILLAEPTSEGFLCFYEKSSANIFRNEYHQLRGTSKVIKVKSLSNYKNQLPKIVPGCMDIWTVQKELRYGERNRQAPIGSVGIYALKVLG